MDANSWLWIAVIALLALCCVPMLFMGRRGGGREGAGKQRRESERREGGAS